MSQKKVRQSQLSEKKIQNKKKSKMTTSPSKATNTLSSKNSRNKKEKKIEANLSKSPGNTKIIRGKRSVKNTKNIPLKSKKEAEKIRIIKGDVKRRNKILSFLWNIFFYVIMGSILIGAGVMAIMQQQDKSLNGYRMFGVLTNSMVSPDNTIRKGGFRSGDIIVTKEVDPKEIKVNDVITYRPSTNPTNRSTNNLTHRVVKVNDHLGNEEGIFFVTRGDANKTDDMPINSNALIGKEIFVIPKLGGVFAFVKDNWLISLIFIFCLVGFIWIIRAYILPSSDSLPEPKRNRKTKKRKQTYQSKQ